VETSQDITSYSDSPLRQLSGREVQVLSLASSGSTNHQIAERLGLSVHAVKFHLASVYRKLGVANRTEAAVVLTAETANLAREGVSRFLWI
jgi:DNA-binding NarL/FixJ family response regulator